MLLAGSIAVALAGAVPAVRIQGRNQRDVGGVQQSLDPSVLRWNSWSKCALESVHYIGKMWRTLSQKFTSVYEIRIAKFSFLQVYTWYFSLKHVLLLTRILYFQSVNQSVNQSVSPVTYVIEKQQYRYRHAATGTNHILKQYDQQQFSSVL
jgi:hypothetical protein